MISTTRRAGKLGRRTEDGSTVTRVSGNGLVGLHVSLFTIICTCTSVCMLLVTCIFTCLWHVWVCNVFGCTCMNTCAYYHFFQPCVIMHFAAGAGVECNILKPPNCEILSLEVRSLSTIFVLHRLSTHVLFVTSAAR